MAGNRVRINVFIDESWLGKLKKLAIKDDRTVGEIIRDAVRTFLKSSDLYENRRKNEKGEWVYDDDMGPLMDYVKATAEDCTIDSEKEKV